MIKLKGEKVRQWDLSRKVEIFHPPERTIKEVWFKKGGVELAVPFSDDGEVAAAEIPNILLKSFGVLTCRVYGLGTDGCKYEDKSTFYVSRREQPKDYVYTETETIGLLNDAFSTWTGGSY